MPDTDTFKAIRHRLREAAKTGQPDHAHHSSHFPATTTEENRSMKTHRFNATHYSSQGTVTCNDCNGKTLTNLSVMANTESSSEDAPKYAHVALMEGSEPIAFFTPESAQDLARALNIAAQASGCDRADC